MDEPIWSVVTTTPMTADLSADLQHIPLHQPLVHPHGHLEPEIFMNTQAIQHSTSSLNSQTARGHAPSTPSVWRSAALTLVIALLTACGGGGTANNSSGGSSTTPTDPSVAAAQRYRLVPPIALAGYPGVMYVLFKSPISASGYNTSAGQWVAAKPGNDPNYCLNSQGQWVNVGNYLGQLSYLSATDTSWVVDKEACGEGAIAHTAQVKDISGQKLQILYPGWSTQLGADATAVFPQGSTTLINFTSSYPVDTLIADTSTGNTAYGAGIQGVIDHYAAQSGNAMLLGSYKVQFTAGGNGTAVLTSTTNATTFNVSYTVTSLRGQSFIKLNGWPTAADIQLKDPEGDLGILNPGLLNPGQIPTVVLANGAVRWATFIPANTPTLDAINAASMPLAMNKTALDAVLQYGHLPAFSN
jgi:hypothetical protein